MNSLPLISVISTLAVAISESFSPEETALIGAVLTQLGDTLGTIAAQKELCQSKSEIAD